MTRKILVGVVMLLVLVVIAGYATTPSYAVTGPVISSPHPGPPGPPGPPVPKPGPTTPPRSPRPITQLVASSTSNPLPAPPPPGPATPPPGPTTPPKPGPVTHPRIPPMMTAIIIPPAPPGPPGPPVPRPGPTTPPRNPKPTPFVAGTLLPNPLIG